jgi:hypothetical protein
VSVGDTGVSVGGIGVSVGRTGVSVGGTGVSVSTGDSCVGVTPARTEEGSTSANRMARAVNSRNSPAEIMTRDSGALENIVLLTSGCRFQRFQGIGFTVTKERS